MKKLSQLTAIVFFCIIASSFAQAKGGMNKVGVRISPVLGLLGAVDVSLDVALGNVVISPEFVTWGLDLGTTSVDLTGYGASLSYHFSGALTDSWYIGAYGKQLGVEVNSVTETGELDTTAFGARAGYLWVWSTFYMNLGAAFGQISDSDMVIRNRNTGITRTESVPSAAIGVGLDFKLGFSF